MRGKQVFKLTGDELAEIVRQATMAGISDFIKASLKIAPGVTIPPAAPLLPPPVKHQGDPEVKPWMICDRPECNKLVFRDDIYCREHLAEERKLTKAQGIGDKPAPKAWQPTVDRTTTPPKEEKKALNGSYTVKEAAELFNRPLYFVYDRINNGQLILEDRKARRKKITAESCRLLAERLNGNGNGAERKYDRQKLLASIAYEKRNKNRLRVVRMLEAKLRNSN
jgi:hypothetical protein